MLHLMLWAALLFAPLQLQAKGEGEAIAEGLFAVGRLLMDDGQQHYQERRDVPVARVVPRSEHSERTWGDRGMDMVGAFLNSDGDLGQAIKAAIDVILDEYREQFKEEGREYARELGGIIAERATEDPKISSTLTSIQILCWSVVVYLTLVTIYLVFTVYRLRRANKRLMDLVENQIKKSAP